MMFQLSFSMNNAAFQEEDMRHIEVSALLSTLAETIEYNGIHDQSYGSLRDTNGNTIGKWEVTSD